MLKQVGYSLIQPCWRRVFQFGRCYYSSFDSLLPRLPVLLGLKRGCWFGELLGSTYRQLRNYKVDREPAEPLPNEPDPCFRNESRDGNLTHGVFTYFCEHGICLGFEVGACPLFQAFWIVLDPSLIISYAVLQWCCKAYSPSTEILPRCLYVRKRCSRRENQKEFPSRLCSRGSLTVRRLRASRSQNPHPFPDGPYVSS